MKRKPLPPSVQEFFRQEGLKGGKKLKRQRGLAYYKKIGKMGGRPKKGHPSTRSARSG